MSVLSWLRARSRLRGGLWSTCALADSMNVLWAQSTCSRQASRSVKSKVPISSFVAQTAL